MSVERGDVLLGSGHQREPGDTKEPLVATRDARIAFIDNARALGIVLVVLGHAPALPAFASAFVFAFHMPLFFFLSGLVVGSDRLQLPTARRCALLSRTLLLPYAFYFTIAFAYWLVAKRHGLRADEFEALPWWDPLIGFATGNADALYVDVVLWFFPCLFVTALAHHVVCQWLPSKPAAVLFAVMSVAFALVRPSDAPRWLWSADCAVVAVGFYAAGAACNDALKHPKRPLGRGSLAGIACLLASVCMGLTSVNGHVDLNHLAFGRIPALYFATAVAGVGAALALSAALPASQLARWLSTNTLVIFPLHFLVFSVFSGIAITVFGLGPQFKGTIPSIAVLYTVGALLASWPAANVLRRYAPWLFHAGRAQRGPTASDR